MSLKQSTSTALDDIILAKAGKKYLQQQPTLAQNALEQLTKEISTKMEEELKKNGVESKEERVQIIQNMSPYIEQIYNNKINKTKAELENAYMNNVLTLNQTKDSVAPLYYNARNQTAADSSISQKNFNEMANSRGLNVGTAVQSELARNLTLQKGLNDLNVSEKETLSAIELEKAKAKADFQSAIAAAVAEGEMDLARALYDESVRVQNGLLSQAKYEAELLAADNKAAAELQYKYDMLEYQRQQDAIDQQYREMLYADSQAEKAAKAAAEAKAAEEAILAEAMRIAEEAKAAVENNQASESSSASSSDSTSSSSSSSKSSSSSSNSSSSSGSSSSSNSSSNSSSSISASSKNSLFEDMRDSGSPYTFLTTNYKNYGITSSAATVHAEIYEEYRNWLSQNSPQDSFYTNEQKSRYDEIFDKLALSSAKQGSDPLNYIRRLESSAGSNFYKELVGSILYDKLIENISSYSDALADMMQAQDPGYWLQVNGQSMSADMKNWLKNMLNQL